MDKKEAFRIQLNAITSSLQDLINQQDEEVSKQMAELQEMKENQGKEIEMARQELQNEIACFEETKKKLEALYHDHADVIDINVGGQKFASGDIEITVHLHNTAV